MCQHTLIVHMPVLTADMKRKAMIMVCHTDSPHTDIPGPGETVSHTRGPHSPGKMGSGVGEWVPGAPILGGPHFHVTFKWVGTVNIRV